MEVPEIEGVVTEHAPESDIIPGEPIEDVDVPIVERVDVPIVEEFEIPPSVVLVPGQTYVPYTKETRANIPSAAPYTQETIADVHEHHFNPEPVIIQPKMDRARRGNASDVIKQLLNFKRKADAEEDASAAKPLELVQKAKIGSILQDAIWNK